MLYVLHFAHSRTIDKLKILARSIVLAFWVTINRQRIRRYRNSIASMISIIVECGFAQEQSYGPCLTRNHCQIRWQIQGGRQQELPLSISPVSLVLWVDRDAVSI